MNILIVEDEAIIAARLSRLLGDILGQRIASLEVMPTLDRARAFLEQRAVDLVFLDLNLHGGDGFDLLKQAVAGSFQTVVVSAHVDRAVEAFEYGVLDFVAKPFNRERLTLAVTRYLEGGRPHTAHTRFLAVKQAGATSLITLDEVAYIRGAGPYAELVLRDGRTLLHGKTLEKLEQLLPPHWQRIHKSYLANLQLARRWRKHEGSKYELELMDGTILPVGRTRFKALAAEWL